MYALAQSLAQGIGWRVRIEVLAETNVHSAAESGRFMNVPAGVSEPSRILALLLATAGGLSADATLSYEVFIAVMGPIISEHNIVKCTSVTRLVRPTFPSACRTAISHSHLLSVSRFAVYCW